MDEQIIEQMQKAWQESPNGRNLPWAAVYAVVEQHLKTKHAEQMHALIAHECRVRFGWGITSAMAVADEVKRRFLAPAAKERVTVEYVSQHGFGWKVFADGEESGLFNSEKNANIYAAGLRAELEGK